MWVLQYWEVVEYYLLAITSSFIMTWSGSICFSPVNGAISSIWKLFILVGVVALTEHISLPLCHSLYPSLSFIAPASLPNYILCPHRADVKSSCCSTNTGMSMYRVQRRTLFLFQLPCSSYLDGLWDGGKWPLSCCLVECCFQNLFKIVRSILLYIPSIFFIYAFCLRLCGASIQ